MVNYFNKIRAVVKPWIKALVMATLLLLVIEMLSYKTVRNEQITTMGKIIQQDSLNQQQQESPVNIKKKKLKEIVREETEKAKVVTPTTHTSTSTESKLVESCTPRRHFAYVKTHKTGSTTVCGILLKFSKKHGVTQGRKATGSYLGGYPGHIHRDFMYKLSGDGQSKVKLQKGEEFNFVNHFRFNATVLREVMPADSLFFSVIRQPWKQFQSTFYYYFGGISSFKRNQKPSCIQYPFFHIAKGRSINFLNYFNLAYETLNKSIPWYFRSKNFQAHDLGLDPSLEDDEEIEEAVRKLDSEIDLMLITDYMDESMILLKEKLCMDWSDMIFLDEGNHHKYASVDLEEGSDVMRKFGEMYKLDLAMYRHFNETLWKKVEKYGRQRMEEDIATLRRVRQEAKLAKERDEMKSYVVFLKAKEKRNVSRKTRSVDKPALRKSRRSASEQMFLEAESRILDRNYMVRVLREKLQEIAHENLLTRKQVNDISKYMVENNGGCPM